MRHRSLRSRATSTTLAALTALALTACSNANEPDSTPSTPPNGPTAPRPTTEPPAPPTPVPSAADGDDTGACTDGNCEIAVTKPVTIHFPSADGGRATLSVTEVGPNKIEYEVKSANGQSNAGASGPGQGCLTYLRENGSGNSCGRLDTTRPTARPDTVTIQATTTTTGTGLLHIVSP